MKTDKYSIENSEDPNQLASKQKCSNKHYLAVKSLIFLF